MGGLRTPDTETMSTLWIIHRDATRRAALARAAGARESAISGGPGDPLFDSAPPADAVLLGLAGDLEAELQFAHRISARLPDVRWVLVAERSDAASARELFDSIDAEILSFPPDARVLRASLQRAARRPARDRLPLSQRPSRDRISQRFARWFADLELPELLRCIDPQLYNVPLLICGEPGTGRGLLARYVHTFGAGHWGAFLPAACLPQTTLADLQRELHLAHFAAEKSQGGAGCTIWLENVDALSDGVQRQLARWIEFGLPPGTLRAPVARWVASAGDPMGDLDGFESSNPLEPTLHDALAGIQIRIPSLRERPHLIASFANDTALAWCAEYRTQPRRFGEDAIRVFEQYPWSANLRELEAVVIETLVVGATDPIRAADLQYYGTAFAPIDTGDSGRSLAPKEPVRAAASASGASTEWLPDPPTDPKRAEPVSGTQPGLLQKAEDTQHESQPPATTGPRGRRVDGARGPSIGIQRLVGAIAHEIRNPLSTIRTFAELLPSRFDDPDFRATFAELVGQDAQRLEGVVLALSSLAGLTRPNPSSVDLGALIEELLDAQRDAIRARHLVVSKELESGGPAAIADPDQIRFALESIVSKSLELAPERGDVYIANHHHPAGLRGGPAIRTLVRFGRSGPSSAPQFAGLSTAENALAFAIAEAIVRDQAGAFSINVSDDGQSVLLFDLPAEPA